MGIHDCAQFRPRLRRAGLQRSVTRRNAADLQLGVKGRQIGVPSLRWCWSVGEKGISQVCFMPRVSQSTTMLYRIALHQSEEGFSVSVPGMPGCWSQGQTESDAIENIKDAIRGYIDVVEEQLRSEQFRQIEISV